MKVLWVPPEYGDAVACILADGTLSVWEETAEGNELHLPSLIFQWTYISIC